MPRGTPPGAAAGRAGDARAASARFLRARGITGDANTSIFGVARPLVAPSPGSRGGSPQMTVRSLKKKTRLYPGSVSREFFIVERFRRNTDTASIFGWVS